MTVPFVHEGGCAGLTYAAEIGRELQEDDQLVLEWGGGWSAIPAAADIWMGWRSTTPTTCSKAISSSQYQATCGCGSSFSFSGFPEILADKCNG